MPHYRLEWQEKKEIRGVEIIINCAKNIIVDCKKKNPKKIAEKEAREIFNKLPESVFTATLKEVIANFQKKEFNKSR